MTRFLRAPALPPLNTRGSSHVGGAGLFVLGLGSLVLLTGLATPDPTGNDAVLAGGVAVDTVPTIRPQWLGGLAMTGVMLVMMGLSPQARKLLRRLRARA